MPDVTDPWAPAMAQDFRQAAEAPKQEESTQQTTTTSGDGSSPDEVRLRELQASKEQPPEMVLKPDDEELVQAVHKDVRNQNRQTFMNSMSQDDDFGPKL